MTHPSGFPRRTALLVMSPAIEAERRERPSGAILIFRIESDLALVADAGKRIHDMCVRAPFTEADACDVALCAREALSNAIEHAYRGKRKRTIDIVVLCSPTRIVVEIADAGRAVESSLIEADPRALADADPSSVADIAERGRGISILHALMDTVRFRTDGGRNVLRLTRLAASKKRP